MVMGMTPIISVVAEHLVKFKVTNSLQETAEASSVRALVSRRSVLLASLYKCDTASGHYRGSAT